MLKPTIHVAIALLFYQGKVLVGWREAHQHQGNKFEFPGGKVEQGESPAQACRREVLEEVGIDLEQWHPFDVIQHVYDDVEVYLHVFHAYVPEKLLCSIQAPWQWHTRAQLLDLNFPKANQSIIRRLYWQSTIQISVDLAHLGQVVNNRLLYWRIEETSDWMPQLQRYTDEKIELLILNYALWLQLETHLQKKVAAIQFKHDQVLACQRGDLPIGMRCIASCHDAKTLAHAHAVGFDAVFLSPVQATASHANADALGWQSFSALLQHCDLPVFALGGLQPQDLAQAQQHGAYGIAGIRGFISA